MLLQNLIEAKLLLVSNFLKGEFHFVIQFLHDSVHRFFLRKCHLSLEKGDLLLHLLLCVVKLLQEFVDIRYHCLALLNLSEKMLCQCHLGRLELNTCSHLLYLYPMLMWWHVSLQKWIPLGAYFLTNSLHSTVRKYTFYMHNSNTHFSPQNDNYTHKLIIQVGI